MNPIDIIRNYYEEGSEGYTILLTHSRSVADKALSIAKKHPELKLDLTFIEEAAMLHDIGVCFTNASAIGCFGEAEYISHGYLGAEILRKEGYPKHALVSERHTGTGLSLETIIDRNLPIPHRDMRPVSLEEQLICFADKFYSKTKLSKEKEPDKVRMGLARYGKESISQFDTWCKLFLEE